MHCIRWNKCLKLKHFLSWKNVFFPVWILRCYSPPKLSFDQKFVPKYLFLNAWYYWKHKYSSREMNQKFLLMGTMDFSEMYLHFVLFASIFLNYIQNYMKLLEQYRQILDMDLVTVVWMDGDQKFVCLVTWRIYQFIFTIIFLALSVQLRSFSKQYFLHFGGYRTCR